MIPYGRQCLDEDDIAAVVKVLRSDYLTTGPTVEAFELAFAEYIGCGYAVAVSSGTAALHLTMLAMGVEPGDRVITSPNTFLASANCVAYAGGTPDFCDTNRSGNIDAAALEEVWRDDCRGIVAVDYAGQPADMPKISAFVRSKGGFVIEDASHGVGTRFFFEGKEYFTGAHPWADATVFSFHPVKTMTSGEGGMVVTDDAVLAAKIRKLRHHGIERCSEHWIQDRELDAGSWYYEMQHLGYNYRLTDIQSALGLSQLTKLDRFIERRQEIVGAYNQAFSALPYLVVPPIEAWLEQGSDYQISWHLYSPQIDFEAARVSRKTFVNALRSKGIGTQLLYIPVYLQPWYRSNYGYAQGKCPNAESYFSRSMSLPLYPGMNDDDVAAVVDAVAEILH